MLLAVNYLHSHQTVHRDLKLENFLYESRETEHLKLIDFGATLLPDSEERITPTGKIVGTTDSERPPLAALFPFSLLLPLLSFTKPWQSRLSQSPWRAGSNHPDGLHLPRNRAGQRVHET